MKAPLPKSQRHILRIGRKPCRLDSHQTGSKEDDGVDQADNPLIPSHAINAELLRERQIGAIGTCLIPSLSSSADGAEGNGVPEHFGAVPLVIPFIDEGVALFRAQLRKELKGLRSASHEGGLAKELGMLGHVMRVGKGHGILDSACL
jgi:hypothetical protein